MKIALTGKMRRGKTSVAVYLVQNYDYTRIGFADKIKEILKDLRPDLFANDRKPRLELQVFGQSAKQVLGNTVWADYAMRRINALSADELHENIVLDDLRFVFEADILRKHGFAVVKVDGSNQTGDDTGSEHESERQVDEIVPDHTITNDGQLYELYKKVDHLLREIEAKENASVS